MTETVAIIVGVVSACGACGAGLCQYYNRSEPTVFVQNNNEVGSELDRTSHSIQDVIEAVVAEQIQRGSGGSEADIDTDINIQIHVHTENHSKEKS